MQLYRIKQQQPQLFARIRYSLHLPQYLSFLLSGHACSDITSIGCHTQLWNFQRQGYHDWVYREGVIDKLAPILPSTGVRRLPSGIVPAFSPPASAVALAASPSVPAASPAGVRRSIPVCGVGLHDSSAALIPYLASFHEPFVLISTGTWCISMNPFNATPLTLAELQEDSLCYLSYQGQPVKASRLFAGHEHDWQVRRLAGHFHRSPALASTVVFDREGVAKLRSIEAVTASAVTEASSFGQRELASFENFEQGYHRLLMDIMDQQAASTRLVLDGTHTKRLFVDGGFGRNPVYMHLLAAAFPGIEVVAATTPQATAMGAALAIHPHWHSQPLPGDLIAGKFYR